MNIDAKILNIQQTESSNILKRSYLMTKWALSQQCKDSLISTNQCTHINKLKDKNHMITSIDVEKAFENSTSIYDKNSPEDRNIRNIPHHNKSYI